MRKLSRNVVDVVILAVFIALIIGLLIGGLFFGVHLEKRDWNKKFKGDINEYSTIVLNGYEYQTDDIVGYTIIVHPYENNESCVTFTDGTKVYFPSNFYTVKNKR